jgi:hypothetical protein
VQCVLIEYAPFSGINTFYLYLYQLSAATDHRFEFKALDVTHDCGTFTVKRDGVNWVVKNENHEALRVFIDTPAHHDRAQVRLEKNVRHK